MLDATDADVNRTVQKRAVQRGAIGRVFDAINYSI
jgi:hypothetical protein